jgi:hypothetical protein
VKHSIRRQIFKNGLAFAGAKAVYVWASGSSDMRFVAQKGSGMAHVFDVAERHFVLVEESDLSSFAYCTSPLFYTSGAVGADAVLATKSDIFCFRPSLNPAVRPLLCQPAAVGVAPAPAKATSTAPYTQATLNAVSCAHTGVWRHLTCVCSGCAGASAAAGCTGWGRASNAQPGWVPYAVRRAPPAVGKQGERAFIVKFVDSMLAKAAEPATFAPKLAT